MVAAAIVVTGLLAAGLALAAVVSAALHRGHDEYTPSVKAFAAFRAALARSDSPSPRN